MTFLKRFHGIRSVFISICLAIVFALQGCSGPAGSTPSPNPSLQVGKSTTHPSDNTGANQSQDTYEPIATYTIAETGKAATIVEKSGVAGGLIVQVHSGDGSMLKPLKISDRYLVQGLEVSDKNVLETRRHLLSEKVYGTAVSVICFKGDSLPYVDNLVNLLVSENLGDIEMREVMRVLAPGGVAMIQKGNLWEKYIKRGFGEMEKCGLIHPRSLFWSGGNV
ncbi:MAG: hypothetical protein P8Z37_16815 [Acidobacteriota bacterium]